MQARHAAAALSLIVLACGNGDTILEPVEPIDELPRQLTVAEREIIDNTNAFGFDLFARVQAADTGPNVFFSPLSASMALGMILNGAASETWDAMRATLHFGSLAEGEINASYSALMDLLVDLDPTVTVRIGNSVWAREGVPFEPAFFTTVGDFFDAEARTLDFDDPAAVDVINGWASDATEGRITNVIDRIRPEEIMFLLNAIYFKGAWRAAFDPDDTRQAPFTRADGSTVTVPMMHLPARSVPYVSTLEYQAIELAYGGGAFAMDIVLPVEGRSLGDLIATLDPLAWDALVAGLDSMKVAVGLPRFHLSYEKLLNDPLTDMGMGIAFGGNADFTRLTPVARTKTVCISFVKQNTFVEVNEEGTEAAAVTTVGVSVTSAPPSFTVDRPFLFVIRERLSGTILFMGAIGDPTIEESPPAESPPPPCSAP